MKSDIPIKRILQVRPEDWITFVFPALTEIQIVDMPTDMVPKTESRMDNVKYVNDEFIFHIEPNGYLDKTMPSRMLRYRADIWENTLRKGEGTPSIKQVIVLFFEKHDNKQHSLKDNWDSEQTLNFNYKVIKVWEIEKCDIIGRKLIGLYPLLPLTKQETNENEEKVLTNAIQIIQSVNDSALKADLLSAMSILAGEKFSKELVKKYVRREQLMESALFKEWVADFVDEAEENTKLEVAKEMVLDGEPIERIMKWTKLPLTTIKKLQDDMR